MFIYIYTHTIVHIQHAYTEVYTLCFVYSTYVAGIDPCMEVRLRGRYTQRLGLD